MSAARDMQLLSDTLSDLGIQILPSPESVVAYVDARAEHLKTLVGQKGYDEALQAEAYSVALFALGKRIADADALDAAVIQTFRTIIAFGVRVLLL